VSTSDPLDCQNTLQTELDLLYRNILHDAVKETTESSQRHSASTTPCCPRPEESFTLRNCLSTKLPQLDDIDNEYVTKKGVFDLPSARHLSGNLGSVIISLFESSSSLYSQSKTTELPSLTYFDHIYTFTPVIDRVDFIRGYQSGDYSLFLLYVMLIPVSIHVPLEVLSACGFANRLAAQELFFTKGKLLHDQAAEDDPLLMLQGPIILCMVILDHPTNREFSYWLHNAIRLATKLDLRDAYVHYSQTTHDICDVNRIY
jgi:hypothetical protein